VTDTWVIQEDELNFEQIFLSGTSSTMATSQHQTVSEDNVAPNSADAQINVPDKTLTDNVQMQLPRVRSRQNANKAVLCPQCGKGYSNNGNLMRHLKFECGKEPQFHCPLCPLRTRHKSNLLSHMYCKHPASYQKM
jgi:Zinc finger, C2H2 type.